MQTNPVEDPSTSYKLTFSIKYLFCTARISWSRHIYDF